MNFYMSPRSQTEAKSHEKFLASLKDLMETDSGIKSINIEYTPQHGYPLVSVEIEFVGEHEQQGEKV